jgi:hypothetical protein
MEKADDQTKTVQIRLDLQRLQDAIAAATREGDIRRNVQLNLEASRLRQQLIELERESHPVSVTDSISADRG